MLKKKNYQKLILGIILFYCIPCSSIANIIENCTGNFDKYYFLNTFKQKPNLIEVEIDKYRNWQKNNLKIYTNNNSDILKKYKKKFKSKIIVHYNKNIKCEFKAETRQSGDHKDHIKFLDGNFIQSIDVELKNGNINGITKFKLLIPETRGQVMPNIINYEDEILTTEIFRNIGFISPRTFMINVKLNENYSLMMFQEKAEKEMLEYHKRREGPILEGDEKYKFTWWEENKKKFNLNIEDEKKIVKKLSEFHGGLSKQTNVNWAIKSDKHLDISEKALTILNKIYLRYLNDYQYNFVYNYSHYNLDNNLLSNNNKDQIIEWDIFQAISLSISRGHGLAGHNRKFYWNSIKQYFEPIYYDGNVYLDWRLPMMQIPLHSISIENISKAKKRIQKINIDELHNEIKKKGSTYDKQTIARKLINITNNLDRLVTNINKNKSENFIILDALNNFDFRKKHLNLSNDEINYYENKKEHRIYFKKKGENLTETEWIKYTKLHFTIVPNLKLIFNDTEKQNYYACDKSTIELDCKKINFKDEEIKRLLSSKLEKDDKTFQYIGKYKNLNLFEIRKLNKFDKIKVNKSTFFFENGIEFNLNEDQSKLEIYQKKPGSKAFFLNGKVKNLDIHFYGYNDDIFGDIQDFPFGIRGLTGCLSFIDLIIENSKINSFNSSCEDAVNFINIKGKLDYINIENSRSDGLDMDFSNVQIENINVKKSRNDCVDVSYGQYNLNKLNLNNCEDKSLSVGENSTVYLDKLYSKDSNVGIASKDSSKTFANNLNFNNLNTCLSAYNKKQEFLGGIIEVKNLRCVNFIKKLEVDKQSLINLINEL